MEGLKTVQNNLRERLKHLKSNYFLPIPSYTDPPTGILPYETIERICLERLKVYHTLEEVSLLYQPSSNKWNETVLDRLKSSFPDTYTVCTAYSRQLHALKAHHYDRICRYFMYHVIINNDSDAITKWITSNEIRLFRLRFINLPMDIQEKYVIDNKIVKKSIFAEAFVENQNIFEVSWKYAMPLVSSREVPLIKGKAFIKASQFHFVASAFQVENISNFLSRIKIGINVVKLDSRIDNLINNLESLVNSCINKLKEGDWSSQVKEYPDLFNLNELSTHFSPCMEIIYNKLKTKHHIKYQARQQFIPFLMDIGLSLDDTLQYIQNHFLQVMSEKEMKSKRYNYHIRYQFGLEGRQTKQKTKTCHQLIGFYKNNVNDCCGCPLFSIESIQEVFSLPSYSFLKEKDKNHLLSMVENDTANYICSKILALKHPTVNTDEESNNIVHPIQYYVRSFKGDESDDSDTDYISS